MWKKLTFRNYFLAAITIDLVTGLSIILLRDFLPPLVPLFYGRPAGEAQLTGTFGLLIAPGVSFLITVINLGISLLVENNFLKRILAISTIVISVLTTITVAKIIFLVGFF